VNLPMLRGATLLQVSHPERAVAFKKLALAVLVLIVSIFTCGSNPSRVRAKSPHLFVVHWEPARLVNGSPILLQLKSPLRLASVSGKWMDHSVFFSFDPPSKAWFGLAGVSLETRPGKYDLSLTATTEGGEEISFTRRMVIAKGKYRHIEVSVAKQFTEPSSEQLVEIKQERQLKEDLFSRVTPEREWEGSFAPPVSAAISDVFGTARVFNGETQSMHQGVDYAVPSGTPVKALNRGTVLLARPLFFEGNCVVLDHGQGLLSLYMHLSKLEVKEGDDVTKGEEIALSGGSGRATGPHLHVAVRWQGVYLNPLSLLDLKLP